MSFNSVFLVAKNEFYRTIWHPVVIIVGIIVLFLAFVYGYGNTATFESYDEMDAFLLCYCQSEYRILLICSIMAAFLGVLSMARDRWEHSVDVLLVKPLYRRDVILGKFIGLSGYIYVFVSVALVFSTLMFMLFFREPLSYIDLLCRLLSYIFILSLECSLIVALTMLVGTLLKNVIGAVSVVVVYVYADWFRYIVQYMGGLSIIMPRMLYHKMADPVSRGYPQELFNTLIPFTTWLNEAMPYILLTLFEIILLILINCFIFARLDDS
ncbi:ABC transporter permease [Methanocella conradii]|uniref:ABC transporter permease n=1 Tax=Methanocella conradii TaxID=1175444 RepID=UPI0024B3C558|nr:ABC transporter permease subunit [Methanocella conradii]MDI6897880.1 ABC transporter permease subunit [Methanocella conradii]